MERSIPKKEERSMQRLVPQFSSEQRAELSQARDHHPKAYLRVKAAALLKIDAGQSIKEVAAHGLLKPIKYETVRGWYWRYAHEGLDGLLVQTGRGRKPAFSPCAC
jgi:hypothetical protein